MPMSALFAIWLLAGCAEPLASSGPGALYTNVTEAVQANNGVQATRSGKACSKNVLGIVSVGDSSVEAAKSNAGILTVATIDRRFFSLLGLYAEACTIVTGS